MFGSNKDMAKNNTRKKILYVRSGPYEVNLKGYNLQELGLASALLKYQYQTDIVYYTRSNDHDQIVACDDGNIKILWRHGIKILRSGIYPSVLNTNFLKQYEFAICSEYSQIMSILLSKHIPTYIYNGPYYNLFKIPFVEPIYDACFCKYINNNIRHVFCKTKMAEAYLNKKGIYNTSAIGVGLDINKFSAVTNPDENTKKLLDKMHGKFNFLYVGSISKRKNILLIINSFIKFSSSDLKQDCQLVLVGRQEKKYKDICKSVIPSSLMDKIVWYDHINNTDLMYVYKAADVFLLPSIQEIYGMVLLEAMYFGVSVISSHTAGADMMIDNGENGIIVDSYSIDAWVKVMNTLYKNENLRNSMGKKAAKTIREKYMWSNIAEQMVEEFEK